MNQAKLLIIGTVFPEPNSSAAGSRMVQLIELFLKQGCQITFASAAAQSEFAVNLTKMGVKQVSVKMNCGSFNDFVRQLNPQMVLFDRFITEEQFGWRVANTCPNALKILDTEDLHCLRHARHKALKENRVFSQADLYNDYAKREIASIYRCDVSLIISEYEMQLLQTVFKVNAALLYYLPFMLEPITSAQTTKWLPFEQRQHFVTIGNFLHPPNWDAVQQLKNNIWPHIKKQMPQAQMHIYGAYASQKATQLHNPKEGFLMLNRAANAKEVVGKARVLLAPLRFGAGLKGKLIEAMQCGTPSITTLIGAEAMHAQLPWSGEIANTPQAFANAASTLYSHKTAWQTAQQNGTTIINQIYNKEKLTAQFVPALQTLMSNLKTHRQQNFIGAMLMHHTMRSTEFMSRWIEEKNKQ